MNIKLTDTQRLLLSVAATRDDRCLVIPKTLKGGAARRVVEKLVDAGLVREVVAKTGLPVWRREEETGRAYALKTTAAGMKAVAKENPAVGVDEAVPPSPSRSTWWDEGHMQIAYVAYKHLDAQVKDKADALPSDARAVAICFRQSATTPILKRDANCGNLSPAGASL
jgi:hypothetical protein